MSPVLIIGKNKNSQPLTRGPHLRAFLLTLWFFFSPAQAVAQQNPEQTPAVDPDTQVSRKVDFEGSGIDGEVRKPLGDRLSGHRHVYPCDELKENITEWVACMNKTASGKLITAALPTSQGAETQGNNQVPEQLELCLVLDVSGSMHDDYAEIKASMDQLNQMKLLYPKGVRVHLVEFADRSAQVFDQANGIDALKNYMNSDGPLKTQQGGGTFATFGGVNICADQMSSPGRAQGDGIQRQIILMTDDRADDFNQSADANLERVAAKLESKKADFKLLVPAQVAAPRDQILSFWAPLTDLSRLRAEKAENLSRLRAEKEKEKAEKIKQLPQSLSSLDPKKRLEAVQFIDSENDPRYAETLVLLLSDSNVSVREAAARALKKLPPSSTTLKSLARLSNPDVSEPACDLGADLLISSNPYSALGEIEAIQAVLGYLNAPYPAVRDKVFSRIQAENTPRSTDTLLAFLKKPENEEKIRVLKVLKNRTLSAAQIQALSEAMSASSSWEVRLFAAQALAAQKDPSVDQILKAQLAREEASEKPNKTVKIALKKAIQENHSSPAEE